MAARGRGLFSLYICIENFKNLLVRNHWTDFNIILQKCFFGDPLPRLLKTFGLVQKHVRQGAGPFSPIYLYRKLKKKNLLVRNHWTDFNIILQKCSFGNPLPRLFKPFGFIKKHGCQGAGGGWSGGAKVLCILHHRGVQLILAYSWARPAILVVGKGRGGMFLFLLFLHFHSCSSFFPVPLFYLFYCLFYLFSPFLWETTQNDPQGLTCR